MIQDQFYPYDTQALVAWPTNLSGIVTLTDVRALKLHYVYTNTQPVSPGTTDLMLDRPTSRHTHGKCRLYWKLIYKWPSWSKIEPLGRLTPVR